MEIGPRMASRGWMPPVAGDPPLLVDRRAEGLALRWSGDRELDAALACPDVTAACRLLFAPDRATRPVVRALAEALLGTPDRRWPGRNAALWSPTICLAVDGDEDRERLDPADLAELLDASVQPGMPTRREPFREGPRVRLRALLRGTPRVVRRNLGVELVADPGDLPDELARLLDQSRLQPRQIMPAHVGNLSEMVRAVELLAGREATIPCRVTRTAAGMMHFPITRVGDYEVRAITSLGQARFEGERMRNCLADHAPTALLRGYTVVTVWHRGRPHATVQLDPVGDVHRLAGAGNRWMDGERRRGVIDVLTAAELLPTDVSEPIRGPADEVAAQISCRAAALLAADLDPEIESPEAWASSYTPGDRVLELLGKRARKLTDEQHARIRRDPTPGAPAGEATRHDDEWAGIAAMLAVAHIDDRSLDPPGTAAARLTAREYAWRLLRRDLTLPDRSPAPHTRVHLFDPALPPTARDGIAEVLRIWANWSNGNAVQRRGGTRDRDVQARLDAA